MDLGVSDDPGPLKNVSIRKRRGLLPGTEIPYVRLTRIRIPVAVADPDAKVSIETLCPPERHGHYIHHLRVHPRLSGRPYRYIYGNCCTRPRPCNSIDGVCRVDVTDGSVLLWHSSPDAIPAGPTIFLPRAGTDPEDETDGVLLVDCLGADGHSFVAVLDGHTFKEVARATLPYRHCQSLGSTWIWGPVSSG